MINQKKIKRNIRAGLISSVLIFNIFFLLTGCNDGESDTRQGLTVANLCFTTEGGDVSNTLLAGTDWKIEISGSTPWISVSPAQGTASTAPINLIFTSLVNNNSQSRSQVILLHIGSNTLRYVASQDGTEDQVCSD